MRSIIAFLLLPLLVVAQTAGPQPTLIYSYEGQSAAPSLLSAISSGGAPAQALLTQTLADTATDQVPALPTSPTIGPTSPPAASTDFVYSSGSPGVVLSSNTRAPFVTSGTFSVSLPPATPTPTRSAANKIELASGTVLSAAMLIAAALLL